MYFVIYRSATRMIAMIAVSWAVSTVISIPPLFGLKDPVVDEDQLHNISSHVLQAAALPDTVGASFNPLVIGKSGKNLAPRNAWNYHADSMTKKMANDSDWINEGVMLQDTNCVISQNLGYTVDE